MSIATQRPVDASYAMTGEISLTGKVLPIGGLKAKILGAQRLGIKKIIIPASNKDEINDWKEIIKDTVIIPVSDIEEVLTKVLLPPSTN